MYVDAPGRPELLVKAQGLIVTGIERLQAARQHIIDNDDPVDADYHVTLFQGDLPELFYFSASIEGFSTLVVAIHDALRHREGESLTIEQVNALIKCLSLLRDKPFMSYDAALDLIDELEAVGFNPEPPEALAVEQILLDEGDH